MELVDRYWDRVYAFAFRLTSNQADAEDIAQEVFLRAFTRLEEFEPGGQFKAWLLRIATNFFLDEKKAAKSREVALDETHEPPQRGPTLERSQEQHELLAAVDEVMQTFSKEQRTVVLLRAMEQMEYTEIADILRVKESTVRWHMYEARRIMRSRLSEKFDLEALCHE